MVSGISKNEKQIFHVIISPCFFKSMKDFNFFGACLVGRRNALLASPPPLKEVFPLLLPLFSFIKKKKKKRNRKEKRKKKKIGIQEKENQGPKRERKKPRNKKCKAYFCGFSLLNKSQYQVSDLLRLRAQPYRELQL